MANKIVYQKQSDGSLLNLGYLIGDPSSFLTEHYVARLYATSSASGTSDAQSSSPYINLVENGTVRDSLHLVASGRISISCDTLGNITFSVPYVASVTNGSTNLVTSGAVYTALLDKADAADGFDYETITVE